MTKIFDKIVNRLATHPNQKYWVLLPFLLLYFIVIFIGLKEGFRKDEWRYIYYAENLLKGYFSPAGKVFLWNGPGYPLLLSFLLAIKWPLLLIKMLNGIFLYFSLVFFYNAVSWAQNVKTAIIATVFLGIYMPAFEMLPYLMTEIFTIFLVSGIIWTTIIYLHSEEKKRINLARLAILLATLALTKVMFGYVILSLIIVLIPLYFIGEKQVVLKSVMALALSILICLPYLVYTYNLTGKLFYWSNAGGMQLYWMTTPHKGEFGDWINFTSKVSQFEDANELFKERHGAIIAEAFNYPNLFSGISTEELISKSNLEQDTKFKELAYKNLKKHPHTYIRNWRANISRMLFDMPYSYKSQSMHFIKHALFNIPLLIILAIGIYNHIRSKSLSFLGLLGTLFTCIYLGGSSLVSAYPRQFYIMIPILLFMATMIVARICQPKSSLPR